MFQVRDLIDMADAIVVAEELGIPMESHGTRVSILCPQHEDHHFGSCFLSEHGYHCFACGKSGDVIDLVRRTNGSSFMDACKFIARLFSCEYLIDTNNHSDMPLHNPLPDKKTLTVLGMSETQTIRSVVEAISSDSPMTRSREMRRVLRFEPSVDGEGLYLFEEIVARRPMQELCDEDSAMFDYIVLNRAIELKKRYLDIQNFREAVKDPEIYKYCANISDLCGNMTFNYACKKALQQLDEILAEYGKKYFDHIDEALAESKKDPESDKWRLLTLPIPDLSVIPKKETRRNMFEYLERKPIGM